MRALVAALAGCLLSFAPAVAQSGSSSKWADAPYLPEYCPHTQYGSSRDPEMVRHYGTIYGEKAFHHMHHYCRALVAFFEGLQERDNETIRRSKYGEAVANFDYVLDRTEPEFILRPEILARKGAALIALDRGPEAVACFEEAIRIRPDYVPAYVSLGGYQLRAGDGEGARATYQSGLERVPDSEILQRKLVEAEAN